jgi:hypothetical protein
LQISSLINDVQNILKRKDGWFTDGLALTLGQEVARKLQQSFRPHESNPTLRLSQLGPRCPRALWHSIHTPELAEALPAWAENKFAFGHIVEAWALTLAKAAGHKVEGEQDELYVDGIRGHRDAVVDGCVVDVKSCSSRAFQKFKDKTLGQNDSFGYLDQLDAYLVGSLHDPLVTNKEVGYLWAIDKQLGHMCLYEHHLRRGSIEDRIKTYKEFVARGKPPECTCGTRDSGKSGNIELDVRASYSAYKYSCFPRLRTFLYSDGPRYLTHVARKPDVTEIDKHGRLVYN